tara:strand:+ start:3503 stop:3790 length:288 start_codon:yes stop_codon:yes gene_type:complete
MNTKMNYYNIKKLISGYKVCPELKSKTLIAVPQKKVYSKYGLIPTRVVFRDKKMDITSNTPLLHKDQFRDRFNRGTFYTLLYYEWMPNKQQLSLF